MHQTFRSIGLWHEAFGRQAAVGLEITIVPAQVLSLVIGLLIAIKFIHNIEVQIDVEV